MRTNIVIGTRGSKLALIQTESVMNQLKIMHPRVEFNITKIVTSGDRDRVTHLDTIGTDVFVKELEEALLDGRIDLAVHSLKDVPTDTTQKLELLAFLEREDPRDVLVAKVPLRDLPTGARIGTGSLRRSVQLSGVRSDLKSCSIRGNVDTRLRKVESGEVAGVILAAAGLKRLGWEEKITQYLPPGDFLPAAGQGTVAIEGRIKDKEITDMVSPLNHIPTRKCITAERTFLRDLGGGCRAPIAALATIIAGRLKLEGMVAGLSGKLLRETIESDITAAELGAALAAKMLNMGASELIDEAKHNETR